MCCACVRIVCACTLVCCRRSLVMMSECATAFGVVRPDSCPTPSSGIRWVKKIKASELPLRASPGEAPGVSGTKEHQEIQDMVRCFTPEVIDSYLNLLRADRAPMTCRTCRSSILSLLRAVTAVYLAQLAAASREGGCVKRLRCDDGGGGSGGAGGGSGGAGGGPVWTAASAVPSGEPASEEESRSRSDSDTGSPSGGMYVLCTAL